MSHSSFESWASWRGEGKWRPKPGSTAEVSIDHDEHPALLDHYTVKVQVNEELTKHPENIEETTTENWPDGLEYPHFAIDVWVKVRGAGPHRKKGERVLTSEELTYEHVTTFFTDRPGIEWRPEDYKARVIEALVRHFRD